MPFTIGRYKAHYHDRYMNSNEIEDSSKIENLSLIEDSSEIENSNEAVSSATAIRSILEHTKPASDLALQLKASVPRDVYDYFMNNHHITYPITIEDFSDIIKYKLLSKSSNELADYLDLSSDMADRIKNIDMLQLSITELCQSIKTKNITLTRVNRGLIHMLLNIKKDAFEEYIDDNIVYYARLLGIKKEASHLIRRINNHQGLPVITKLGGANKRLGSLGLRMLNKDIFATHLYNQIIHVKYKTSIQNEYKHGIVII